MTDVWVFGLPIQCFSNVLSLKVLAYAVLVQLLMIGGNPAGQDDGIEAAVGTLRAACPRLDVAWRATDRQQLEESQEAAK